MPVARSKDEGRAMVRALVETFNDNSAHFRSRDFDETTTRTAFIDRLFEALGRAFLADEKPKCLLIDDLQWCDQETLEWLRHLLHAANYTLLL